MLKHFILPLIGFVALTSAAFTPEKNFFFLPLNTGPSSQLFQTRHGIIAYSVDFMKNGKAVPHYSQINLETNNVTQIIPDLPIACRQGPSIFDRFIYHVLTYSFVYYCTNNNSILLLDPQNNFQVQSVFSLSIKDTFDEVRMITDGYSVAIMGMSGLFSQNPGPSHLIKFNLQNQQVVNHVVFDHGLAAGEFVSAYGTNGNFFVITNIINSTTNIANVYGMTLIGNSYTLTHLATFNSTSTSNHPYTLPEFYVNKNLIFTSNEDNLVILDENGNLQKVQEGVALKNYPQSQPLPVYRPAIVSYPGSGSLFVSLWNNTLLKISVVNQGFNVEDQGLATSVSLAIQDQLTDTLLFSFSGENSDFRITNADSGKVVYESVNYFDDFMITDKTYSAIRAISAYEDYVKIFDRETNQLIQTIQFNASYTTRTYYDQKSSTLSYLLNKGNDQYELQQIDLRTGMIYTLFSFNATGVNQLNLVHATNDETFDSPQFIIQMTTGPTDDFLILSHTLGQVRFVINGLDASYDSTLAVDYDTLDAFYFQTTVDESNAFAVIVTAYSYVSSNDSFVSTKTTKYPTRPYPFITPTTDYSFIETFEDRAVTLSVIEMSSLNRTDYSIPTKWQERSNFQNSSTGFQMILSQGVWGLEENPSQIAGMLYDNQIQELPGTTNSTVQAGVAGSCSYWVLNQVGCFGVVEFYNICNDIVSEIIA